MGFRVKSVKRPKVGANRLTNGNGCNIEGKLLKRLQIEETEPYVIISY